MFKNRPRLFIGLFLKNWPNKTNAARETVPLICRTWGTKDKVKKIVINAELNKKIPEYGTVVIGSWEGGCKRETLWRTKMSKTVPEWRCRRTCGAWPVSCPTRPSGWCECRLRSLCPRWPHLHRMIRYKPVLRIHEIVVRIRIRTSD